MILGDFIFQLSVFFIAMCVVGYFKREPFWNIQVISARIRCRTALFFANPRTDVISSIKFLRRNILQILYVALICVLSMLFLEYHDVIMTSLIRLDLVIACDPSWGWLLCR